MEEDHFEDAELDLTDANVVTKFRTASDIANRAIGEVIKQCLPGRKVVDVCTFGDKYITDQTATVYKTVAEKGIAFPTCISINNCVGHFSPLSDDSTVINEGDVVKVDLGVHIDGFVVVTAHTWIAASAPLSQPITGRKADVICAAHYALEAALRLFTPGKKNTEVTEVIGKVAEAFKCSPMEAVLSHQMKRYVIDGNKVIISKSSVEQRVEEFEFEENEVYALDIVMSTGEGKPKEGENRITVFKRALDQNYSLKMTASKYVFSEVNKRFPTFPFTLRALDESRAKLGITECLKHDLFHTYPVIYEKAGEFVAHFKTTVLIQASGTKRLNTHPLPFVSSEFKLTDPELVKLVDTPLDANSKKNKKKAAAAAPASTPAANSNTSMDTS